MKISMKNFRFFKINIPNILVSGIIFINFPIFQWLDFVNKQIYDNMFNLLQRYFKI